MKILSIIALLSLLSFSAVNNFSGEVKPERQWPAYRGNMSSGVLDNTNLPDTFNISGLNVKWKIKTQGLGLSSPVIWDNKLFITTAISKADKAGYKPGIYGEVMPVNDSSEHEWKVICLDKNTGKSIWEQTSHTGIPAMKRHPKSTHANTSVATDGKYVVAFFGSEGLYCYDMKGKLVWEKNFGILKSVFFMMKNAEWEFASSPIIYNGMLIIQCDVLENSFLAAFDTRTGKQLWKTTRDDYPGWATPNIYKNGEKEIVVVNGYKHIGGYDLATGNEVWKMSGGGDIPIPTPVTGKDMIYINGAHGRFSPILAISTDAVGDISLKETETSNQFVRWSKPKGGSYMHTMLLYNNHLYNVGWNGLVSCLDPSTGKEIYNGKLGKARSFIASPVASDGKVYIVDEEGIVYILRDGSEFKVLSEIPLNDVCMTAPSLTDGMIYFRTQNWLYAIGR
jgi:outer membrane protein assembly factor BamB